MSDCFLLICRTSFAAYTLDWLEDAALEFGFVFKGQMSSHQQNKKPQPSDRGFFWGL